MKNFPKLKKISFVGTSIVEPLPLDFLDVVEELDVRSVKVNDPSFVKEMKKLSKLIVSADQFNQSLLNEIYSKKNIEVVFKP